MNIKDKVIYFIKFIFLYFYILYKFIFKLKNSDLASIKLSTLI
jgi:hypothetical protein